MSNSMFRAVIFVFLYVTCATDTVIPLDAQLTQPFADPVASPLQLVETTTPPPVESTPGVIETLVKGIMGQLRSEHKQWVNAWLACIVGVALIYDGDLVFKGLVVFAVFILAMLIALNDATAMWGLGYESYLRTTIGLEVGVACAYVAYRGIDGVMLVVGAALGSIFAYGTQTMILNYGFTVFQTNYWLQVVWYSVFVLGMMAVLAFRKHKATLAILAPFLGGALVVSAVAWFISTLAAMGAMNWIGGVVNDWKGPATGPWVDFLELLMNQSASDVGIIPGKVVTMSNHDYPLDQVLGDVFWFLLFMLGAALQFNALKKEKEEQAKTKVAAKGKKGGVLSSLQQPILKDEV